MNNEDQGSGHGEGAQGGRPKYNYFVDGTKYESNASSITGAQIKANIPNFNSSFQIFLEGKGGEPDRLIADSDSVDLTHGSPKLYTAPPATFGAR